MKFGRKWIYHRLWIYPCLSFSFFLFLFICSLIPQKDRSFLQFCNLKFIPDCNMVLQIGRISLSPSAGHSVLIKYLGLFLSSDHLEGGRWREIICHHHILSLVRHSGTLLILKRSWSTLRIRDPKMGFQLSLPPVCSLRWRTCQNRTTGRLSGKICMWSFRRMRRLTLSACQKFIYVCLKGSYLFFLCSHYEITTLLIISDLTLIADGLVVSFSCILCDEHCITFCHCDIMRI